MRDSENSEIRELSKVRTTGPTAASWRALVFKQSSVDQAISLRHTLTASSWRSSKWSSPLVFTDTCYRTGRCSNNEKTISDSGATPVVVHELPQRAATDSFGCTPSSTRRGERDRGPCLSGAACENIRQR